MTCNTAFLIFVAFVTSVAADATGQEESRPKTADQSTLPAKLPQELRRFNGMLIGRLVSKDVERGSFVVTVDRVSRVWRNSKAENPKRAVGRNLEINGVSGKWLDVLLLIRPGETLQFEARHDRGDALTFPGEAMRKVPAVKPGEYPDLPEGFRGFEGVVNGKIVKKDDEMLEIVMKVNSVRTVGKASRAKEPKSIEGQRMILAGFWQQKDSYYKLRVGEMIEAGIRHLSPRSEHLSVQGSVRSTGNSEVDGKDQKTGVNRTADKAGFPKGLRGFRGIMSGRLKTKDVEKGELIFVAEKVERVWKQNKATDLKSVKGREFRVRGISGKWLDVLLVLDVRDKIEVEAFHNRGDYLDFVGEWLKKVE